MHPFTPVAELLQWVGPLVSVVCLTLPGPLVAQSLSGWSTLLEDEHYDHMIFESDTLDQAVEADSLDTVRVILSRMLVRHRAEGRAQRVRQRLAAGQDTTGYGRYASTTLVVDVRCASGELLLRRSSDFDEGGVALSERGASAGWVRAEAVADSVPGVLLLRRVCREGALKPDWRLRV